MANIEVVFGDRWSYVSSRGSSARPGSPRVLPGREAKNSARRRTALGISWNLRLAVWKAERLRTRAERTVPRRRAPGLGAEVFIQMSHLPV